MKKIGMTIWLWSMLLLSGTALASSWQGSPEARLQLHQLGLELALADVHPELTLRWQQAVSPETASDAADDSLWLGLAAFWRQWATLNFEQRQYLQTRDLALVASEAEIAGLHEARLNNNLLALVRTQIPGYGDYDILKQQLARLLAMADEPWPALAGPTLRPGEQGPAVALLRQRLQRLGDMEPALEPEETGDDNVFDQALAAAVARFQHRHGLQVDGVVGPHTYAWLDVLPRSRAQLLMRSMLRTLIGDSLPASYLLVNIPEYRLRLYQRQVMVLESDVIVGQDSRKTPIMHSNITNVVVNPPWNVPRSIINKDIVPRLYKDPGYIARQGFEVLDGSGRVVPDEEWRFVLYTENRFPFRLRQRPGNLNALGAWKFHLPNNEAIYLHDTPARGLFARDSRALSSGCVRVANAEQLALWLLSDRWSPERLAALKATRHTRWLPVSEPLPIFMVYWRGWLGEDGLPRFRDDIYDFDLSLNDPFARRDSQT
ncbi:cell wall degradation protein [Oceanimonas doudoroffii]|uniref:Cell wall degradation protein n=2 Tax=Oceanimonas doudoroffii TaxID=84158 RepID=A0A233RIQ1_9GAMM|nr:cell wall degradation protein [Oceanimonas doudoroffii]